MGNKLSNDELEEYLESGGLIRKDCWIRPMHIRYNPITDLFELVTTGHTYNGDRGLQTIETFYSLTDIPYVGKWVKCNEKGEDLQ